MKKTCSKCNREKKHSDFHRDSSKEDGLRTVCKKCICEDNRKRYVENPEKYRERSSKWRKDHKEDVNARNRQYRLDNPEWYRKCRRKYKLRHKYGLTEDEFYALWEKQKGQCANDECENPAENIDHDHETGRVRGLLCSGCNKSLGLLGGDVERIKGLARYIQRRRDSVK